MKAPVAVQAQNGRRKGNVLTRFTFPGPDGLFTSAQVNELVLLLGEVHAWAVTST